MQGEIRDNMHSAALACSTPTEIIQGFYSAKFPQAKARGSMKMKNWEIIVFRQSVTLKKVILLSSYLILDKLSDIPPLGVHTPTQLRREPP
jgi:hypothetical protein